MFRQIDHAAADQDELSLNSEEGDIATVCIAAVAEMRVGKLLEAQLRCRRALETHAEEPELLHLMALIYLQAAEFDYVVEWASRAIRKDPRPSYLKTLGTALLRLGRQEEAVLVFDKAVQLKPDDADLWQHLGNTLLQTRRLGEALLCFQHAVKLNPADADAAYKAGLLLKEEGRVDEALVYLDRSAEARPDHAPTFALRGFVRASLKQYEQAIGDFELAIRLDPEHAQACSNLGNALKALGHPERALVWYDRSLALKPDIANATNRALTLTELGRFLEAEAAYRYAMSIDAQNPSLVWNHALLQLLRGDFEAGWRGREARWNVPEFAKDYPMLVTPMWTGEAAVAGKTVVICQTEGVGDAIQFVRYIPMLAARGARIILVVDQGLCPLLSGLAGVSHCLPKTQRTVIPPFDLHIAIDSLPFAFGTQLDSIPLGKNYLPPPEPHLVQAWEDRLGLHEKMRVGLVWSGNPKHGNDRNRSVPLRLLSGLLNVDALFVSLQKNPRPEDAETLREREEIVDHTALLTDFAETAALVSCLDLVVTVDTSVAHLAGALGRPTWILLPYAPDWRWLLGREDSPWYPTVRLFRQTETREYDSVIERVRRELSAMAEKWKHAADQYK
ncbi:putative TPR domain protein [Bradyrhizobium sp. STM 3843]|uniref:tetratricopeptide repeat-containing glycosyltransferase family protein n=1 Tax=Bradyrhizobium sp. STM 3843 TaxID=551947 RepID=UPI00024037BB|nr:tetratricopeptide repeat-containing glycosyltransferase family protein [Bradyrhizobium sp. STM 3843]CCE08427.1 putative TPR domain protein [Bradyrhizobium sp. STM 3843]